MGCYTITIMELQVQKLHPKAKIPSFAHDTDAGMDLCCVEEMTIAAGERAQIKTGIALAIPEGFVGLVWDKSGLAYKAGLTILGGVVDSGYTGEILILLQNTTANDYTFSAGDKITQILIQKVEHPEIVEVDSLQNSQRGNGGFGSTGI